MDGKQIRRSYLEIARAVLILSVVLALVFYNLQPTKQARSATFYFTQSDWSQKTSNTALHDTTTGPPSNWNQYSDNDNTVTTGAELKLNTAAFTRTLTTDTDFSGGATNQTHIVGQGINSTIQLTSSNSSNFQFPSYTNVWMNDMQVGSDGYSRILFNQNSSNKIFIRCLNGDCSQYNFSILSNISNASFMLDSNDLAQIFYKEASTGNLKFMRCSNKNCDLTSSPATILNNNTGQITANMILGPESKPMMLYSIGPQLNFVQCNTVECYSKETNIIAANSIGYYGAIASLDLGPDNLARIAYMSGAASPYTINFIRCLDLACSSGNTITSTAGMSNFNATAAGSTPLAMRIGTDDRANIVYRNIDSKTTLLKCADNNCSTGDNTIFEVTVQYPHFAIDLDQKNIPSFSYEYYPSGQPILTLINCINLSCSNYSPLKRIKTVPWTGSYTNLEIGPDGYTRMAYRADLNLYYPLFNNSGTFTSGAIDMGIKTLSWGNLSWTNSGDQSLTNITMEVRSGTDTNFSNHPNFCSTTLGASLLGNSCISSGDRYFQYRATLTTTNQSETPKLDDVTIGYTGYPASATLTSSVYNTNQAANIISKISWNGSYPTSDEIVKFQIRSSPDGTTWTNWCGFTVCDNFDVFEPAQNGIKIPSSHILNDGIDDQYFQYKAILYSGGIQTPVLNDITVTYVVNAPPEIKNNAVAALQISDPTDPNWGKIKINFSAQDIDTNEGTTNPGKVSSSFFYDLTGNCALTDNNCWQAITNSALTISPVCDITANQIDCPVTTAYTDYAVLWNAAGQLKDDLAAFSNNARIRVVLNDNEAANNIARAASPPTTLDTKPPIVSVFKIDSTLKQINLTATDDSILEYRISNKNDLSSDGVNALSNDWQKSNQNSITIPPTAWSLTGSTDYENIYFGIRDQYNNLLKTTYTAPYAPRNIDIKDVSNVEANNYRLFIIWDKYDATSTAQFGKYEVYRSTDGNNFSLLTSITDINLNYYPDISVLASTRYYYKIRMVDADGDVSDYSKTLNDLPNGISEGEGGGSKPLTISIAPFAKEIKAFSAKIAWSTSDRSNSTVYYSTDKSFSKSANNTALVADHEVLLTGLSASTVYYFKVESTDITGKKISADNDGNGYSFATVNGPTISGTTVESVTNKTATISWNTNIDTNSYVIYSRSIAGLQSNSSINEIGDANLVGGPPYQHRIKITGLQEETIYYFYVKSIDSENNMVIDNNKDAFYSLKTTNDTKPPVISAIDPITILSKAAVIGWTTDEPSDGQIEFGNTSGRYLNTTPLNTNLNIDHVGVLSELTPKSTYYYRVKSADAAGNAASSDEQKLETSAEGEALVVVTKEVSKTIRETIPPIISNIRVISVDAFKTTIAFDTDEPTIGFILHGKTSEYKNAEASTGFATKHEITLPGLTLGTTYHFQVKAQDQYGNSSRSEDKTFTTKFISEVMPNDIRIEDLSQLQDRLENLIESIVPSLTPPIIGNVKVTNLAESSATIIWKTNVKSSSQIMLAGELDYASNSNNPYGIEYGNAEERVKEHKVELFNLKPNTRYHFIAKSFSLPQIPGKSADNTFFTKVSRIQAGIFDVTNNSFRAIWATGEPTSSIVEYQNLTTKEIFRKTDDAKIANHAMKIENLTPATTYKVKIFGYNQSDDIIDTKDSMLVTTSQDTTPPQITGLKIDSALIPGRIDRTQTVVTWHTDEPATTLVYYQEGNGTFDKKTASKVEITDSLTQNHIISIASLKVGAIYQIQVASMDQAGNYTSIDPRTIVAPQQPESIMDIIFKNFADTFKFVNKLR